MCLNALPDFTSLCLSRAVHGITKPSRSRAVLSSAILCRCCALPRCAQLCRCSSAHRVAIPTRRSALIDYASAVRCLTLPLLCCALPCLARLNCAVAVRLQFFPSEGALACRSVISNRIRYCTRSKAKIRSCFFDRIKYQPCINVYNSFAMRIRKILFLVSVA